MVINILTNIIVVTVFAFIPTFIKYVNNMYND